MAPKSVFPLAVVLSAIDKISAPMRKVGSGFADFGRKMTSVGKSLTVGVTAPLAGLAVWSLKAGVDFDRSFQRIRATTGATTREMEEMRRAVRAMPPDLGMRRAIGVLQGLGEEGMSARESLDALMATTMLAKAANLEEGEAAGIVADTLAAVGLEARRARDLTDLLMTATRGSSRGMKEMAQVLQVAGPGMRNAGLSLEDMIAATKGLAAANFEGSAGASALKVGITALMNPSSAAIAVFERLGIAQSDLFADDGKMRSMADVIDVIRTRGGNATDMLDIFGARAGQAFAAVDTSAIRSARAELDNFAGATKRGADAASKGAAAAFERLTSSLDSLRESIASSGLLDSLTEFVTWLAHSVKTLSELNPGLLKTIVFVLAAAAAIGPLITVVGSMSTAISILWPIVTALGGAIWALTPATASFGATLAATPVGWLIGIIAALVGAVVLLVKYWDEAMAAMRFAWELFSLPIRSFYLWIMKAIPGLEAIVPDWIKHLLQGKHFVAFGAERAPDDVADRSVVEDLVGPSEANAFGSGGSLVDQRQLDLILKQAEGSGRDPRRTSEASVRVEFENMPPNATVTKERATPGMDLNVAQGYAMS